MVDVSAFRRAGNKKCYHPPSQSLRRIILELSRYVPWIYHNHRYRDKKGGHRDVDVPVVFLPSAQRIRLTLERREEFSGVMQQRKNFDHIV